jgi:hypothetical protein
MSLAHVWASCPTYNLSPLFTVLYHRFCSLHPIIPGTISTSTHPWLWGSNVWYPLIAFRSLDTLPHYSIPLKQLLGTSCRNREWALSSFLWYIWHQCMDEVHNSLYHFCPDLHADLLAPVLQEPHV